MIGATERRSEGHGRQQSTRNGDRTGRDRSAGVVNHRLQPDDRRILADREPASLNDVISGHHENDGRRRYAEQRRALNGDAALVNSGLQRRDDTRDGQRPCTAYGDARCARHREQREGVGRGRNVRVHRPRNNGTARVDVAPCNPIGQRRDDTEAHLVKRRGIIRIHYDRVVQHS